MLAAALSLALATALPGQAPKPSFKPDQKLDAAIAAAATSVRTAHEGLMEDEISICLVRLDRTGSHQAYGSLRGDQSFYPASVVKLFYLAYAATQLDAGTLEMSPEVERAFTDMIVDSSNDATHAVVDVLTKTTGGPELPETDYAAWVEKRNIVNRWLRGMDYKGINVCQKTYCEGPYGRERRFVGAKYDNRNSLTAYASARMMAEIALGGVASESSTVWMNAKLARAIPADGDADFQSRAFIGKTLPKGSKLWSKAGYVDSERHDVAWVRFPDGVEWVLAIFTKKHGGDADLIPEIAAKVWKAVGALPE